MSKLVKLLASAYVNGALRHPHEGVLHLEDAEADRLLGNEAAEEVTEDFTKEQRKDLPVEGLRANPDNSAAAALDPVEHQASIPTADADQGEAEAKENEK